MRFRRLLSRQTLSRFNARVILFRSSNNVYKHLSPSISPCWPSSTHNFSFPIIPFSPTTRFLHSTIESKTTAIPELIENKSDDPDDAMNEFLSRFVYIMRGKLSDAYTDCDKQTVDAMLLVIVEKVVEEMEKGSLKGIMGKDSMMASGDFSEDLWRTVSEVSNRVFEEMEREKRKEKMKSFLQSEEVKAMARFASEVGIRGDMLRELRFKWAREKMEESEFYEGLERLRAEEKEAEEAEAEGHGEGGGDREESADGGERQRERVVSLPKRHGKIKYKIYGLDLSDPKWKEVADRIHDAEEVIWPQEAKPITGKCKLVTEKIVSLKEEDDPSPLLAEWVELLQPNRVDWMNLLDKLKERGFGLYLKITEHVLDEPSFQTNIRDFSTLIDAHAKENHLEDAERILKKMNDKGVPPDIITLTVLVHMYSRTGILDRAKEAFEALRNQGFKPDMRVYSSMIMAYVSAGQPKLGESLMREMEARDSKPTNEIYLALLRSFSQRGDVDGAQRISTTMQFAGIQPSLESCTLLVEAYGQAGDPDLARNNFDYMMKLGHKPDDRCTASMIAAYARKNMLDKALNLLLQLEKDGFEPGVATYTVLLDWLSRLQLVDEAEKILEKIAQLGETPSFKIQVSLCDMYSRAKNEKKALQALGILEARKDELAAEDFERIVRGLIHGGFLQDARRIHEIMEAQGFQASEPLKVALMASQAFRGGAGRRPGMR